MKNIYSKIQEDKLLHIILRKEDVDEVESRKDIIPEENFLQLGIMRMPGGKKFKAHKHIFKKGSPERIAQESWFVIRGKVKIILYDLDDQILEEVILKEGDLSVTLEGGHNYEILEDDTLVYEYKTGPYEGQKLDKEFIDD